MNPRYYQLSNAVMSSILSGWKISFSRVFGTCLFFLESLAMILLVGGRVVKVK